MNKLPKESCMTTVVHVGVVGADIPGGIAQLVEEYKVWKFNEINIESLCTTRRKRDPISAFLLLRTLFLIAKSRTRRGARIYVIHMSQGGSFLREGLVLILCRILQQPAAAHLHGSNFVSFAQSNPTLVRTMLRQAVAIYTLSTAARLALRDLGLPQQSVFEVKNAVSIPADLERKRNLVLFAGHVGERKGVPSLVAAWARVSTRFPEWQLLIAGPVNQGFKDLHSAQSCTYLGPLSRQKVLALQSKSSIAVLPSTAEALPMFLIESMSRSCAVIGTAVGQVPDLIGEVGIVLAPGDVDGLESALVELMGDPEKSLALGRRARERVSLLYSEETVSAELETQWLKLAGAYRAGI